MAIRSKLTERDPDDSKGEQAAGATRPERSEEEKAQRRQRVERAKDALKRSAELKGEHVHAARAALKSYLQRLNDPRQPSDEQFEAMVEAPFRQPPKKGAGGGRGRGF